MQDAKLKALGEEIEGATALTGKLETRARAALAGAGLTAPHAFENVDAVLALVDAALPGWAISLEGNASPTHGHGDWTCTLRRSRGRDNDEVIGIGRSPHLCPALLAALIKVLSFKPSP